MITKEAIEAGLQHYSEGGCSGLDENERREVVEAIITAAFAAMPGPAVKVKPLEWSLCSDGETYEATSVLGRYAWWTGYFLSPMLHDRKKAVDPSAAAQADYEARILSALTPAPDLASENERLRAALEPFAFLPASIDIDRLDEDNIATVEIAGAGSGRVFFFVRDVLVARELLGALS